MSLSERLRRVAGNNLTLVHITPKENWKKIQKSGGLDPNKTALHEEYKGEHRTLFASDEKSAHRILKTPFWIVKRTKGYVLLSVDVPREWVFDFPESPSVNRFIPLSCIKVFKEVPQNKPDILFALRSSNKASKRLLFACRSELHKNFYYLVEQRSNGVRELVGFGNRKTIMTYASQYREQLRYTDIKDVDPKTLWL